MKPAERRTEDALIAVLKSEAPYKEKADACRELARAGTAKAVPVLAALLGDEKLSHMARYALEPIPDDAVDEALRAALGEVKGRPLVGVIGSVSARRDVEAIDALVGLADAGDAGVARAAAGALGKIGTRKGARALRAKLSASDAALRRVAADGCLACAERLVARGRGRPAAALYESVAKAELPEHVRHAAAEAAESARRAAGES